MKSKGYDTTWNQGLDRWCCVLVGQIFTNPKSAKSYNSSEIFCRFSLVVSIFAIRAISAALQGSPHSFSAFNIPYAVTSFFIFFLSVFSFLTTIIPDWWSNGTPKTSMKSKGYDTTWNQGLDRWCCVLVGQIFTNPKSAKSYNSSEIFCRFSLVVSIFAIRAISAALQGSPHSFSAFNIPYAVTSFFIFFLSVFSFLTTIIPDWWSNTTPKTSMKSKGYKYAFCQESCEVMFHFSTTG